ncbi:hypothetical protein HYX13_05920, partial [Candidatus Woesearchaeota archaeon]|nr:hypothetical protein [Candidatus Woesearchaeota archaeon]
MKKILVLPLLVIILLVISCTPPSTEEEIVVEKINLEGKTAEEVLDKYLFFFNYDGIDERLRNLIIEQQMTEGFQLEYLKVSEDYFRELNSLNNEWIKACASAKVVRGEDLCKQIGLYGPWGKIKRNFEVLSKNKNETINDSVRIKIRYKMSFENAAYEDQEGIWTTTGETVYFLRNYGGVWRIYDGIDENGRLFSSVNLQQEKENNQQKIKEQQNTLNEIKKLTEQIKETKVQQKLLDTTLGKSEPVEEKNILFTRIKLCDELSEAGVFRVGNAGFEEYKQWSDKCYYYVAR